MQSWQNCTDEEAKKTKLTKMKTEKLTYKSYQTIEFVWENMYKHIGWIKITPIERKWSWKHFRWVYEMEIQQTKDKVTEEIVSNNSETNTRKTTFSVRKENGDTFKKTFYTNPDTFDMNGEFKKWSEPILSQ